MVRRLHALEKEMATPSNVLAWRIPGTGASGTALPGPVEHCPHSPAPPAPEPQALGPGELTNPGIKPMSLRLPAFAGGSFPLEPPEKSFISILHTSYSYL